jgi:hypothetical protein
LGVVLIQQLTIQQFNDAAGSRAVGVYELKNSMKLHFLYASMVKK